MKRLRELDFLRGVAILLVFCRHSYLVSFTKNMGWIGVDLFFVLSGFLVSGLLFKEYLKFGDIQPKRFLIRRGFKIYPIYYLFYIPYLIVLIDHGLWDVTGFLSDMTFTQNYINGWGYAYPATWSLAVEEHFYFGFSLILWFVLRKNTTILKKSDGIENTTYTFEISIISIMALCLGLRLLSNISFPELEEKNLTMTHLRVDSLLMGVLVAYLYYFKIDLLNKLFTKHKVLLLIVAVAGLSWTPFIDPVYSFYVKTIGLTFLYVSFGILLLYFILEPEINSQLNKTFSAPVVNFIGKIGYCSYSIYIIHSFINDTVADVIKRYNLYDNRYVYFIITSALSISIGMIMTHKIETFFLKIRDKYYPSRA